MIVLSKVENSIKLKPQSIEDLWHLEKIIKKGDFVSASTQRKFVSEGGRVERKPVHIKLSVEKSEFHEPSEKLKVLGIIVEGKPEEFITIKAHHSFEIGSNDVIKIEKSRWMQYELDRIKEAQRETEKTKLHLLIIDERTAELFALKEFGIKDLGKVQTSNRGKYSDESKEIKNKYYSEIFELVKNTKGKLIVAGPGFEAENFSRFLKDKNFKDFVLTGCQNTGRQGVHELIQTKKVEKILEGSRIAFENQLIESFVKEVATSGKVAYGFEHVKTAVRNGQVDKLLVVDNLLFEKEDEITPLLDSAEQTGVKVHLISRENEMSEKLTAFGGVVALLRY